MTLARVLVPVALCLILAGCGGHGKYTTKFKKEAAEGQARLRAGTDYDLALQQFRLGNLARAQQSIESSIARDAANPSSQVLRGRIMLELNQVSEAISSLDAALALNDQDEHAHYYRAIALESAGRPDEARESYRRAGEINPAKPLYQLAEAELLMDAGKLSEAASLLTRHEAAGLDPAHCQMLGHIATLQNRPDEAMRRFSEAVMLSSGDAVFLEDLSRAQAKAGLFASAEANLRRRAQSENFKKRPDLQLLHAACLIELDRPVEARRLLRGIVDQSDGVDLAPVWARLIDVALMLGDQWLLHDAANSLIRAAPERYEGYLALAMWRRGQGDLVGAMDSVKHAMEHEGTSTAPRRMHAVLVRER